MRSKNWKKNWESRYFTEVDAVLPEPMMGAGFFIICQADLDKYETVLEKYGEGSSYKKNLVCQHSTIHLR